jgi:hypothetical protein
MTTTLSLRRRSNKLTFTIIIKNVDKDFVTLRVIREELPELGMSEEDIEELKKYDTLKDNNFSATCICKNFSSFKDIEFMLSDGILCWRCPICKVGNIIPDEAYVNTDSKKLEALRKKLPNCCADE